MLRGLGGGAIIGMPLLYTMEMWFIGMYVTDWHIAGFLLFALLINMGLNHISGFEEEHNIWSDMRDSVVAIGAGAVLSLIVLTLIDVINPTISFASAVSMVALGAVPVSIGFSIANTQFGGGTRTSGKEAQPEVPEKRKAMIDIGATMAGAAVFVFAVAPTEEIVLIMSRTTGFHWAALVVFSLLLTYAIVFVADFSGAKQRMQHQGFLQRPLPETLLAYVLSVLVSLLLLFLLGRSEAFASISMIVAHSAVIGLPAAVGGAAARLII